MSSKLSVVFSLIFALLSIAPSQSAPLGGYIGSMDEDCELSMKPMNELSSFEHSNAGRCMGYLSAVVDMLQHNCTLSKSPSLPLETSRVLASQGISSTNLTIDTLAFYFRLDVVRIGKVGMPAIEVARQMALDSGEPCPEPALE